MRVVTITDTRDGILAFDLVDILPLLEPELACTDWSILGVEAVGQGAEELHRLDDARARVSGPELLTLARIVQVVDGEFTGYNSGLDAHLGRPWVIIRALDSSGYDVASPDSSVIDRVKAHFSSVVEIPGDQYFGSAK